ncbi:MAG: hypothetical protein ACW981_15355 [Candidatus Hodarchaeales archaeon]|jgi:hypothetical protein
MFDERLREFLGDDFELLNKPAIYMNKEEKWKILQALLWMFGAESEGNRIIVFKEKEESDQIEQMKISIENMLDLTLEVSYQEEKKHWELEIKDLNN